MCRAARVLRMKKLRFAALERISGFPCWVPALHWRQMESAKRGEGGRLLPPCRGLACSRAQVLLHIFLWPV